MEQQDQFSFEDTLVKIREIVSKMQQGIQNFDQQMDLFSEGTSLIGKCQEYLDKSELKIQQMINGNWEPFQGPGQQE